MAQADNGLRCKSVGTNSNEVETMAGWRGNDAAAAKLCAGNSFRKSTAVRRVCQVVSEMRAVNATGKAGEQLSVKTKT